LKSKGANDKTLLFIAKFLDTKEGEVLIAAFLASLLHFGPKHIPMLPDKLRTDPRVSRLAKELGVKATADGMTAIYKELEQLVTPLFEQLVTDMKNLPEEKVRVKEEDFSFVNDVVRDDNQNEEKS
jgi:hypothetical protein